MIAIAVGIFLGIVVCGVLWYFAPLRPMTLRGRGETSGDITMIRGAALLEAMKRRGHGGLKS